MFWLQPRRSEPIYLTSLSLPAWSDPWAQEPAAADIKTCWAVLHPSHYITPQKDEIEARSANQHPGVFMLNVLWNCFFLLSQAVMKWPRHLNQRTQALMIVLDYAKYHCSSNTFFFFFSRWCNIWAPQTGNLITFKIKVENKKREAITVLAQFRTTKATGQMFCCPTKITFASLV